MGKIDTKDAFKDNRDGMGRYDRQLQTSIGEEKDTDMI